MRILILKKGYCNMIKVNLKEEKNNGFIQQHICNSAGALLNLKVVFYLYVA